MLRYFVWLSLLLSPAALLLLTVFVFNVTTITNASHQRYKVTVSYKDQIQDLHIRTRVDYFVRFIWAFLFLASPSLLVRHVSEGKYCNLFTIDVTSDYNSGRDGGKARHETRPHCCCDTAVVCSCCCVLLLNTKIPVYLYHTAGLLLRVGTRYTLLRR